MDGYSGLLQIPVNLVVLLLVRRECELSNAVAVELRSAELIQFLELFSFCKQRLKIGHSLDASPCARYVSAHGRIFICCGCHCANRIPLDTGRAEVPCSDKWIKTDKVVIQQSSIIKIPLCG